MSSKLSKLYSIIISPILLIVLVAAVTAVGCRNATATPDSAPRFASTATVLNQTYEVGEAITTLILPAATDGDGPLTYTLTSVPGLTFNAQERRLTGTPTAVGDYEVHYLVQDSDDNTDEGDAATLTFTITVYSPTTASVSDAILTIEASGQVPTLDRSSSLSGPDSNADGVRDDVERYIDSLPDTTAEKASLRQVSRALTSAMLIGTGDANSSELRDTSLSVADAVNCIWTTYNDDSANEKFRVVRKITVNTPERLSAYLHYNNMVSGRSMRLPKADTCGGTHPAQSRSQRLYGAQTEADNVCRPGYVVGYFNGILAEAGAANSLKAIETRLIGKGTDTMAADRVRIILESFRVSIGLLGSFCPGCERTRSRRRTCSPCRVLLGIDSGESMGILGYIIKNWVSSRRRHFDQTYRDGSRYN